ncbi:nucleotide sugar dehydrogenase [Candidatus Woesearchaeota archaeon]|nr:nucleotide sugar dehydrogenase [Candidatus Woesearchaeota archaeon]
MQEIIGIAGMGYVGLPLALHLAKNYKLIGYDISTRRIEQLSLNHDWSLEHTPEELKAVKIEYTTDESRLKEATFIIVTVPTPVTKANIPDLTPVEKAAEAIGRNIQKGAVVVLESTVYPGVTEDVMGRIIERVSGLKMYEDFKLGYSPERINPGDREHAIDKVIKVISGQDEPTLERVSAVYSSVCKAGVYKAANIKVAEAAKVIENTQRDMNIALMNELSKIFRKIGIQTKDVLDAAGTKWNFQKFSPGLVGGHCIGVDPYYLTHRAQELGYNPDLILASRKTNDSMARHVVELAGEQLNIAGKAVKNSTILVLGVTFKENCKDCRNSKVAEIISELKKKGANVLVHDSFVMDEPEMVQHEIGVSLTPFEKISKLDQVIIAVSHNQYKKLTAADLKKWMPDKPLLIDIKNTLNRKQLEADGITVDSF